MWKKSAWLMHIWKQMLGFHLKGFVSSCTRRRPSGPSPLQSHLLLQATPPLQQRICLSDFVLIIDSLAFCFQSLTRLADPLQVAGELPLDLLLSPKLQELLTLLHSFSLFGKFSDKNFNFLKTETEQTAFKNELLTGLQMKIGAIWFINLKFIDYLSTKCPFS